MSDPEAEIVPASWSQLDLAGLRGTIVVIGASDTGKSTLARYLYRQVCLGDASAAYLDLDVGQSTLGLPTTQVLAVSERAGDARWPPSGQRIGYFVGAVTPRGHMLPMVVGAFRLQQKALALGAGVIVVDTTGLVDPDEGGKALKQWKIELLAPQLVIGLQRGGELEPILSPLRRSLRLRTAELRVSPHSRERPREERIERRRERLARYLDGAGRQRVSLRRVGAYDLELLSLGGLAAFQDGEGFLLALGVVEELDPGRGVAVVRTPLRTLDGVVSLRFGSARWDLAGQRERA